MKTDVAGDIRFEEECMVQKRRAPDHETHSPRCPWWLTESCLRFGVTSCEGSTFRVSAVLVFTVLGSSDLAVDFVAAGNGLCSELRMFVTAVSTAETTGALAVAAT